MSADKLFGVGLLVGAVDRNATDVLEDVRESLDEAGRSADRAGEKTTRFGRTWDRIMGALNVVQLDRIRDAVEGLNDRIADGLNVSSTSLESWGAQFGQTYRAATAGLGQFQGIVDSVRGEISGVAHSLQIDAADMVQATSVLARAGHRLSDYGLSVRDLGGSIQAGLLGGQDLANVLTSLSEGYDLGAAGAGRLLDRVTALGERFGVGADAARAMPQVLQAVDAAAARFPDLASDVSGLTESVVRLGLAQQQRLGGTFSQHIESAAGVLGHLADSRRGIEDLLSGVQGQFPELAQEIGIATGSASEAFDTILQDPLTFAARMAEVYRGMDQGTPHAMRLRRLLEQMGPGFSFLIQGGEESARALEAAGAEVTNFQGAYSRMARSASGSTRTFAESMDLANERFQTQLNSMVHSMPGYRGFERNVINRQTAAYRWWYEWIDRLANRNGPFASLTRVMLASRRGGIGGFAIAIEQELGSFPRISSAIQSTIPFMGALGDAAVGAGTSIIPLAVAFKSLGFRLPRIGGMFQRVGSVLRTVFGVGTTAAGRAVTGGAVRAFIRRIPFIGGILGVIFDLPEIIQSFRTEGITGGIRRILHSVVNGIALGIPDLLRSLTGFDLIERIFDHILVAFNVRRISEAFRGGDIGRGIFEVFTGILGSAFGGIGSYIRDYFEDVFGFDPLSSAFERIKSIWNRISAVARIAVGAVMMVIQRLGDAWDGIASKFIQGLAPVGEAFDKIYGIVSDLAEDALADQLKNAWIVVGRASDFVLGQMSHGFDLIVGQIVSWSEWMKSDGVDTFIDWAIAGVRVFFRVTAGLVSLREHWQWFVESVRAGGAAFGVVIRSGLMIPILSARNTLYSISDAFREVFEGIRVAMAQTISSMISSVVGVVRSIPGVGSALQGQLDQIEQSATSFFETERNAARVSASTRRADARRRHTEYLREAGAVATAERSFSETYAGGARRVASAMAGQLATGEAIVSAMNDARGATRAAFGEFGVAIGGLSAEGRARSAVQLQEQRRIAVAGVEGLNLSEDERGRISSVISSASDPGSVFEEARRASEITNRRRRGQAISDIERRAAVGATEARRPGGRPGAGGGSAAREAARGTARDADARRLARELVIDRFGREAARQLRDALQIRTVRGHGAVSEG